MRARTLVIAFALSVVAFASTADVEAQSTAASPRGVSVEEHLGDLVPGDVFFRDHRGKRVRFGDSFDGSKPVVVVLMYHRCAMLCSVVLDSLVQSLRDVDWSIGDQYDVVTLSIDPRDGPDVAAEKRRRLLATYDRPSTDAGWTFLVGDDPAIHQIADALGFRYRWDAEQSQYAHPAVVFVLGGDRKISRYLYGVDFPAREVKLALLEASEGRTVSTTDRVLLYCYQYDPKAHRYVLATFRIVRVGAACILAVVGGTLAVMWSRERRRRVPPQPPAD